MKVLSAKSLDQTIITSAQSLGLDIQCMDFIETIGAEFNLASVNSNFDSVVFTSSNAVKYFFQNKKASQLVANKNIFSLSGKTQEDLLKLQLNPVLVKENADDLADAIIESKNSKSVLHVAGNLTLDTLETKLGNADIHCTRLVVYQTILKSEKLVDKNFEVIMFYSPSGVESFFIKNEFDKEIVNCCIGKTTAAALKGKYSEAKIILPLQPTLEAMIDAIYQFAKSTTKP